MAKPIPGTDIFVVNNQPTEKILVIATNYIKFIAWCKRHKINYRSPMVRFVWNVSQLYGHSNVWFVDLGLNANQERKNEFYSLLAVMKETQGLKEVPQ